QPAMVPTVVRQQHVLQISQTVLVLNRDMVRPTHGTPRIQLPIAVRHHHPRTSERLSTYQRKHSATIRRHRPPMQYRRCSPAKVPRFNHATYRRLTLQGLLHASPAPEANHEWRAPSSAEAVSTTCSGNPSPTSSPSRM